MCARHLAFIVLIGICLSSQAQQQVNIHSIQTNLPNSPYLGQTLTTEGIVVAVLSDGFYIENSPFHVTCTDPAILNCWDAQVSTSEGIFVYIGGTPDPTYASVGNLVWVTGTVTSSNTSADAEARGTEIQVTGTPTRADTVNYTVPPPVASSVLASAQTGVFGQWLEFEGMRINIPLLLATSGTGGTIAASTQTATTNGQFWGVLDGSSAAARPFRGPGISALEPVPSSAPPTVACWSGNPSLLFIDSSSRGGPQAPLDVTSGATVSNLTGVVDYHESALGYTGLIVDNGLYGYVGYGTVTPSPEASGTPAIRSAGVQVTFATQNLDNFEDDSSSAGAVFNARVDKTALAIVQFENSPNVIGVQEIESLDALNALAAQIAADGGPTYTPCWFPGNDPAGLANGFLINESTVHLVSCQQVDAGKQFQSPDGTAGPLFARPPVVLVAGITRGGATDYQVTVVNSELLDRTNIADPTLGAAVRARRAAQAEELSSIIQGYQAAGAHVVALGGYNSFEFNDGFVDTMGSIV